MSQATRNRRQYILWRTLAAAFGEEEHAARFEKTARKITADLDLPPLLLDPRPSIDQILSRHPELASDFEQLVPTEDQPPDDNSVRRALLFGKILLNTFDPSTQSGNVSAAQYQQWLADVDHLERVFGYRPGELRTGRAGSGHGKTGTAMAPEVSGSDVEYALSEINRGRGLLAMPQIQASLAGMEKNLINRMALREVLSDTKLANKLTPSMALLEQLLRDKGNLEGTALVNAKRLIRRYVDQLKDILRRQVESSETGKIDYSVPPRRTFRNLDLRKTIWRNLVNWDPDQRRLHVDQLYYRHTATLQNITRMIIVVDQSGSMVDALVNCTILASIFAGLPRVDAHLIAFDTEVLDLSPWVHDPFEVLLRTNLGGGTNGPKAMLTARSKIVDPRQTVMVWISDFYDDQHLLKLVEQLLGAGVKFIPVGSVSSTGYFNVNSWFRAQFKKLGTPIISGSLRTLIREMKTALH